MKQRSKILNDLIVSLESQGLQVDQVTEADLAKATEDIEGAQASLESFQLAYNLLSDLHSKDVLSLESYSCIMNLTMSNVSISMESDDFTASDKFQEDALNKWRKENGHAGQEDKDSLLKRAKDKVVTAFKWLMEKVQNLFKRVRDFMSNAFTKMGNSSKKVAEWFKGATGFKRDVFINVSDVYLIVKDEKNLYDPKEIDNAVKYLYTELPKACAEFVEDVSESVDRNSMSYLEVKAGLTLKNMFKKDSMLKLANVVVDSKYVDNKAIFSEQNGLDYMKLKGVNVAVTAGFYSAEEEVVGTIIFDKNELTRINPSIKEETFAITTKNFRKMQEMSEILEDNLENFQKEFDRQKDEMVNKSLNKLKDDLQESLNKGLLLDKFKEEVPGLVEQQLAQLITKHLNGAFVLRAKSQQAAIQVLNCTNKLLWRVYKVENDEMSDSKDVAIV